MRGYTDDLQAFETFLAGHKRSLDINHLKASKVRRFF
ncbi:hypothetical protein [Jeotgalibacillus soli]